MASEPWTPPRREGPWTAILPQIDEERFARTILLDGKRGTGKTFTFLHVVSFWQVEYLTRLHRTVDGEGPGGCSEQGWSAHQCVRKATLDRLDDRGDWRSWPPFVVPSPIIDLQPLPRDSSLLLLIGKQLESLRRPLSAYPDRKQKSESGHESGEELQQAWEKFVTSAATASWRGSDRGARLDFDEFVWELESGSTSQQVAPHFRGFVNELALEWSRSFPGEAEREFPFFLIPIDDADMSPHHSAELLWILGALCHPRVGYLLTGDIQQLETKLGESLAWKEVRSGAPPGGVTEDDRRLAREVLEKILPVEHRLSIPVLNLDERFDRNLGELLSRISSDHGREVLSAFLRRDMHTAPAVPGKMRKHQALASMLRRMAPGQECPPAYELVQHIWHTAIRDSPLSEMLLERVKRTVEFTAAEPASPAPADPIPPEAARRKEPQSSRATAGEGPGSRGSEDHDGGKTGLPTRPQLWIDTTNYLFYPRPATRFTWALPAPSKEIPGFGGWRLDVAAVERPALYFFEDAFSDVAHPLDPALGAALCLAADVAASFSWGGFANEPLGVSGFQNPFIRISFLWKKYNTQFSLTWPLPLWDSFRDGYRFGRLFLRLVDSRKGDVLSAEDLVLPYLALAGHVSLFSAGPGYTDLDEETHNDNLILEALHTVSGSPRQREAAFPGPASESFLASCHVVWELLDGTRKVRRARDTSLGEFDRQFVNARREMTRTWVRGALSLLEQPESGLRREFREMLGRLWKEPFVTNFRIERMSASALRIARIQRVLAGSYHSGERTELPFREYESLDTRDMSPEQTAVRLVTELDKKRTSADAEGTGTQARQ